MGAPLRTAATAPAWRVAQRLGRCDPRETIVIAGTPRGGTTLVLEALSHLEGYKGANEPDILTYARAHGFTHRTFMAPGQRHERREAYLERVLSGQLTSYAPWQLKGGTGLARMRELASARKLVVKFCRINRMLQWFEGRFEVRRTVLVIRHPCAAVASMLQHGAWKDVMNAMRPGRPLDLAGLPAELRERFQPLVDAVETPEDALAVAWCIDNYVPLLHFDEHPWILLPYERLIRRKDQEVRRLAQAFGLPYDARIVAALDRPSSSTRTRPERDAMAQLTKWTASLSPGQVARILRFVEQAGLSHLYGSGPEPEYEALNRLQDPRWRWSA
jgi:hypothetical protein